MKILNENVSKNIINILKEAEDVNIEDELQVNLEELAYYNNWSENRLDNYIKRIEKKYNIRCGYTWQVGPKENLIDWLKSLKFEEPIEEIYKAAKAGDLSF